MYSSSIPSTLILVKHEFVENMEFSLSGPSHFVIPGPGRVRPGCQFGAKTFFGAKTLVFPPKFRYSLDFIDKFLSPAGPCPD
jgi:hypothetical protein